MEPLNESFSIPTAIYYPAMIMKITKPRDFLIEATTKLQRGLNIVPASRVTVEAGKIGNSDKQVAGSRWNRCGGQLRAEFRGDLGPNSWKRETMRVSP